MSDAQEIALILEQIKTLLDEAQGIGQLSPLVGYSPQKRYSLWLNGINTFSLKVFNEKYDIVSNDDNWRAYDEIYFRMKSQENSDAELRTIIEKYYTEKVQQALSRHNNMKKEWFDNFSYQSYSPNFTRIIATFHRVRKRASNPRIRRAIRNTAYEKNWDKTYVESMEAKLYLLDWTSRKFQEQSYVDRQGTAESTMAPWEIFSLAKSGLQIGKLLLKPILKYAGKQAGNVRNAFDLSRQLNTTPNNLSSKLAQRATNNTQAVSKNTHRVAGRGRSNPEDLQPERGVTWRVDRPKGKMSAPKVQPKIAGKMPVSGRYVYRLPDGSLPERLVVGGVHKDVARLTKRVTDHRKGDLRLNTDPGARADLTADIQSIESIRSAAGGNRILVKEVLFERVGLIRHDIDLGTSFRNAHKFLRRGGKIRVIEGGGLNSTPFKIRLRVNTIQQSLNKAGFKDVRHTINRVKKGEGKDRVTLNITGKSPS